MRGVSMQMFRRAAGVCGQAAGPGLAQALLHAGLADLL